MFILQPDEPRPRTFEEVIAAEDPAERARMENGESFDDVTVSSAFHREVSVHEDRYGTGEWRVEYFDADGALWVTVCRFERPGEKVIRPWNHKIEEWKWPEGLRPLFNLQQIKTARDPVILVEGEKCVEALRALGYTATTSLGGSGADRICGCVARSSGGVRRHHGDAKVGLGE